MAVHPHKIGAFFCRSAGDALVSICPRKRPLRGSENQIGVVAFLRVETGELFFKIGGYTAVGGHAKLPMLIFKVSLPSAAGITMISRFCSLIWRISFLYNFSVFKYQSSYLVM